jgi:dephospho-CoA kinase
MNKIFITGISGTGKTVIADALQKKGINAFDMDMHDLCCWINKNDGKKVDYEAKLDKEFIDSHVWVCDTELLKKMLDTEGTVVMLGHPENTEEILPLFDKFILLQCKPETFLKRILERKDNDFGKDETAKQHLLDTYKKFENDMLKLGAESLNVEGPLDDVINNIMIKIKENHALK